MTNVCGACDGQLSADRMRLENGEGTESQKQRQRERDTFVCRLCVGRVDSGLWRI